MPRKTPRERKRQEARLFGITNSLQAFDWVASQNGRINIIVEGDSWFAYPKEWLIFGPNSNVIDQIFGFLSRKGHVNTLCRASNGDTAKKMLGGKQLGSLTKLLKKRGGKIDLFLFSAGGNDVVGKRDLLPLLNDYKPDFTADKCVKKGKLKETLQGVIKKYETLLDLRDKYAPQMEIVTHTYDIAQPWDQGAEFLWGVEVTDPWIYPYLKQKGIPENLHIDIVTILLGGFRERLLALEKRRKQFHVADTQGTLVAGSKADWLNEIHPTSKGFKKIAKKIYAKMKGLHPELPAF